MSNSEFLSNLFEHMSENAPVSARRTFENKPDTYSLTDLLKLLNSPEATEGRRKVYDDVIHCVSDILRQETSSEGHYKELSKEPVITIETNPVFESVRQAYDMYLAWVQKDAKRYTQKLGSSGDPLKTQGAHAKRFLATTLAFLEHAQPNMLDTRRHGKKLRARVLAHAAAITYADLYNQPDTDVKTLALLVGALGEYTVSAMHKGQDMYFWRTVFYNLPDVGPYRDIVYGLGVGAYTEAALAKTLKDNGYSDISISSPLTDVKQGVDISCSYNGKRIYFSVKALRDIHHVSSPYGLHSSESKDTLLLVTPQGDIYLPRAAIPDGTDAMQAVQEIINRNRYFVRNASDNKDPTALYVIAALASPGRHLASHTFAREKPRHDSIVGLHSALSIQLAAIRNDDLVRFSAL